jgi:hypothetical protein
MDWLGILGLFVGVIGTFVGIFGAAWGIWQWLDTKRKGDVMVGFLHGLKTGELHPLSVGTNQRYAGAIRPTKEGELRTEKEYCGRSQRPIKS